MPIALEFANDTVPETETFSLRAPGPESIAGAALRPTILLVDDNPVDRRVFLRQLSRFNLNVSVAHDGVEAAELFTNGGVSLILMDCRMPVMDGFSATRSIREYEDGTNKRVPIIALTAENEAEIRRRCFASGMDDFLAKPVRVDDFASLLRRWLPGHSILTFGVAFRTAPAPDPGDPG
jgi:CheY-like chemotaxis protein